MKYYVIILSTLLILFNQASAQCEVQTNQREDGVTVRYLRPERVGYTDQLMLALSMQTNGSDFFVVALSIFQTEAIKLKGNLTLKFNNNKSVTLQHYRSEITTFNGLPATMSIFNVGKNALANISTSNIHTAMLQLSNNVFQVVNVKMNSNILKTHYNCLKD